ncbi:alpha-galactosidase [Microbacterium sp. SA39]|uniref:alpha-galactosidase n=1 Tax=Microbacterium sp. SA39 TaxID=1263625 RepID=UPI0005F9BA53|nr:alpha-galactosidase [Microbacterium sp. SA39]KJQ52802.1 Alpha-galactosidase [Microbacterium sp. SA39]
MSGPEIIHHLRRGGVSVVVTLSQGRLPRILHWGADLGDVRRDELEAMERTALPPLGDTVIYAPQPVPMLPQLAEAWLGEPGLVGSREGAAWAPLFRRARARREDSSTTDRLVVLAEDPESDLEIELEVELHEAGLLRTRATLRNLGGAYRVDRLGLALPVPSHADELFDLAGRWTRERSPQRRPFDIGAWVREARGGKPGFEAPTLTVAGEHGFDFRRGEVWGIHLGWSGNQRLVAERTSGGSRMLSGGELLYPDELVLGPGDEVVSPWLYGSWGVGLDALAARFHGFLRARPNPPAQPRPILLNTWEAVYFDHDEARLIAAAERAAALGMERFVLDDGWFGARRHDRAGLGDWVVSPEVWPRGLDPLADRVHELGMAFGLWFEPEMVNLDSDLVRAHPDWVFDAGHGVGIPSRHQHVLDLGHEGAFDLVLSQMSALIEQLGIDFIKWDHNRSLLDAGHTPTGRAGHRAQTLALYRLLDELRARFPRLEIEACASGGGRIDLGMIERVDRVWASDCSDPHERVDINRWTSLLLPPELIGTHIGEAHAYSTGRTATLGFRAAVASMWQLGVEAELGSLDDDERAELADWIAFHREHRPLLHSGRVVHADAAGGAALLDGVVGDAGAVYLYLVRERPADWPVGRLRLPGLDADRRYRVRLGRPLAAHQTPPWARAECVLSGQVLQTVGIEAPGVDVDDPVIISAELVYETT